MKYLFFGLVLLLAMCGIIFYTNMMHFACIVSLFLAIACGVMFTRYLNAQYEKNLEKQDLLRKRITADVAHELRTPLTAVSANLEAIVEGALEPTMDRINLCYSEIQRLSKLVANMESLAKTDSDVLQLNRYPLDLLELTKEIFPDAVGASVIVNADRERLLQVLTNLYSNAVKYGRGEVYVTVQDEGKFGEIVVKDNGIGIDPEDLPHIFERFYRVDKSRSRFSGGAGIGLAIVKSIVDAHDGFVIAKSDRGLGSCFIVQLPKN